MGERRRIVFRRLSALMAGVLLLAAAPAPFAQGGNQTTSAVDKGEITKCYFLMGPFGFAPTDFGFIPEARAFGGGPWWVPLSDCEIELKGHKNVCQAFVIIKYSGQRPLDVALYYGKVICRRFVFQYDAKHRLIRRIDTEYEPRNKGEWVGKWIKRMAGKTPKVTCTREMSYTWSADGRSVSVDIVKNEETATWAGLPEWPSIFYGKHGTTVQKWTLNDAGRVVAVRDRGGDIIYAATYDSGGRIISRLDDNGKYSFTYDPAGRIARTDVRRSIGDRLVFANVYPGSAAPKMPKAIPNRLFTFKVMRNDFGRARNVEIEGREPPGSISMTFVRNAQGRVTKLLIKARHMRQADVRVFCE